MVASEDENLRAWSAARWPAVDWTGAEVRVGAFHRVVLSRDGPIMRAAVGTGHAVRVARELATARIVAGLGLTIPVPRVLDGAMGDTAMTAILIGRTPGVPGPGPDGNVELFFGYRPLLDELAGVEISRLEGLPPVRSWCGGSAWPEIVERVTAPLSQELRLLAGRLVTTVLEVEGEGRPTFVHGDFGPHNVLWRSGRPASLIDFDHACVADPAIDVAPLIGVYGAAAVATIVEPHLLHRAMAHLATLSLQVSCAAHLVGQQALSDFALRNFTQRAAAGVLHDPAGTSRVWSYDCGDPAVG